MSVFGGELEAWAGDDWEFRFAVKDADGAVQDITGWTAEAILTLDGDAVALTATWTITTAASGLGKITMAAADTEDLEPGIYNCRARRTNSGSESTFSDWRLRVR